ncbi:MAG TPA: serine/threonine-protein kinase [Lacipirellulaceae bacterium]|nr:serine/threonine-protein kinase [Lacipirellulaceae bacterium]
MQPFSDKTTIGVPGDKRRAERLAAVLDAYMRDLEGGGIPPDLDRLIARHPDLADELRSYADSLQLLHQMTAGLRPLPTRSEPNAAGGMATKRLGDYDILREIGRGGMGIVYEARQLSLNRLVALKVLPFAAMLDEKQITRFRNEAQAAAQLHHPNIVPVHAVGQERGVHFFAMQYVPGQSLERALDEIRRQGDAASGGAPEQGPNSHVLDDRTVSERSGTNSVAARAGDTASAAAFSTRASVRTRGYCQSVARLMIQAADAIQHAHECGVIHRDVKPSNLLLDREGKLWVTDFGLARMQSDSGVTMTGDVVGTLRYMSPEQAAGATGLVDARADVYSLGATMYELLTLRPAHSGENRQAVLRHIEQREPTPPRTLNPAIPIDLETITLRALAKSRDERYSSAAALSNDLRLFLEGRPTVAQRPTALDRAAKWALRHRVAVTVGGAVLLLLSVVSAGAAVMIAREQSRTADALERARGSLAKAERSDQHARRAVDQFGQRVASELAGVPGMEPLRRRLLGQTLAFYRQFIEASKDDPRLQRELASVCFKAASIAQSLGDRTEAIELCTQAVGEFDELARQAPDDAGLALQRAECEGALGLLLAGAGRVDAARDQYAAAIRQQESLLGVAGGTSRGDVARSLADSHSKLGLLLAQLGEKEAARRALRTAIELVTQAAGSGPLEAPLRHELSHMFNNLSFVEREVDWARAEQSSRRAIELLEQAAQQEPEELAYRSDLALFYNNLGAILAHRGNVREMGQSYRRAVAMQERLVRQAPAVVGYRCELAVTWNNWGQALDSQGSAEEAANAFAEAERIVSVLVDDHPDELRFRSLYGAVLNNRAMAMLSTGQPEQVLSALESAIRQQRVAFERAPDVAEHRELLSKHYYNLARALMTAGQPKRAAEMALARRGLWRGDGPHLAQVAVELAQAAVAARALTSGDGGDDDSLADRLEAETAATLRDAAAAGDDLAVLRGEAAFRLLKNSAIASMITGAASEAP